MRATAQGIAVILDVAFNHAWGDHPYYNIYPPLYGPKRRMVDALESLLSPHAVEHQHVGRRGLGSLHPETTRYFQDIVRFWLTEYHIDGFRFDWVGGVDYDSNEPLRPGLQPLSRHCAICWAARQAKPDCILIGEFWQLEGTHGDKTAPGWCMKPPMDAVWNGHFHHTLDDVLNHRWEWEKKDIFRAIGGYRDLGFSAPRR
jgi:1,4-alpha-glucan branching enzyme